MGKYMSDDYEQFMEERRTIVREAMERGQFLDSDGYPTEDALAIIENWDFMDVKGWFEFIEGVWWMPGCGWKEDGAPNDFFNDENVWRYEIATGGWSGCEDIIGAMRKSLLWSICWVQSRRGGHYIFERKLSGTLD